MLIQALWIYSIASGIFSKGGATFVRLWGDRQTPNISGKGVSS
jgi:hypothetical protein